MTELSSTPISVSAAVRAGNPHYGWRCAGAYLASGMSEEEILADFPQLKPCDIGVCLAYDAGRERRVEHSRWLSRFQTHPTKIWRRGSSWQWPISSRVQGSMSGELSLLTAFRSRGLATCALDNGLVLVPARMTLSDEVLLRAPSRLIRLAGQPCVRTDELHPSFLRPIMLAATWKVATGGISA